MAGELRAGATTVDITPAYSIPLSGYGARDGPSTDVHDEIAARSLVLDDGARAIGIVSVDVLNTSREVTAAVRRELAKRATHIDDVLVAATHTHAAPYVPTTVLDIHPTLAVEEDVTPFVDDLVDACVEGLTTAHERLAPATVRIGTATAANVAENRRATEGWGVRVPKGEIDPELSVVDIETDTQEIVAFNFALHPVCTTPGERSISADWPAYTYERLEAESDRLTPIFLNGAAGDINPRGKTGGSRTGEEVYRYMEAIGTDVAAAVLDARRDARSNALVTRGPITAVRRSCRLPVKSVPEASVLRNRLERIDEAGDQNSKPTTDPSYLRELLSIAEWGGTQLPTELQYFAVGGVGLLGMPGEIFARHGRDLKAQAAVETLLPIGYANDYIGYVPTLDELENGGYEVRTAKIAPEGIVRFREEALDLVRG